LRKLLAEKLDAWFDGVLPLLESNDTAAQSKALLEGVGILDELDRRKEEGIAVLSSLLNRQDNSDDRVASLVQGFVCGAQLLGALYELGDTDGGNQLARLVRNIVGKLDANPTALALRQFLIIPMRWCVYTPDST
jgi:hypothetical protein